MPFAACSAVLIAIVAHAAAKSNFLSDQAVWGDEPSLLHLQGATSSCGKLSDSSSGYPAPSSIHILLQGPFSIVRRLSGRKL